MGISNPHLCYLGFQIRGDGGDGEGLSDEFNYVIDEDAIGKFLSKSSTTESDNLGVHLAVLKELPKVIDHSIEGEIHPDYKKVNKLRSNDNGVEKYLIICYGR